MPLPTVHQFAAMGLVSAGGEAAAQRQTDPQEARLLRIELVGWRRDRRGRGP
ncbi:hypothetical protein OG298_44240 (plasmid) [Streptomyces sp. NBC_01005]|uniref:hypothetical protein n=1 Tax=unclassified Streptomyces TaxID=2593676 RepID=UPI002F910A95|nr:hypothetical protein OG298_44240 [Streptomyces sp. NBC_01005]WTD00743.1 hypothetical protein OH736_44245 [Streptomyces sp. NBC_01650]